MKPVRGLQPDPEVIGIEAQRLVRGYLAQIGLSHDFPGLTDRIERFAALLTIWGARMNLTAEPGEPSEIAFHVIDSLMPIVAAQKTQSPLHRAFVEGSEVLDLGSGAGFPGLILAAASRARFTLTESRRKRSSFLSLAAAELVLENVRVEPRRVKPGDFGSQHDVVTARAFAAPSIFYQMAASALRSGGLAVLYANPGQTPDTIVAARQGLVPVEPVAYSIPRADAEVRRILILWRRS